MTHQKTGIQSDSNRHKAAGKLKTETGKKSHLTHGLTRNSGRAKIAEMSGLKTGEMDLSKKSFSRFFSLIPTRQNVCQKQARIMAGSFVTAFRLSDYSLTFKTAVDEYFREIK